MSLTMQVPQNIHSAGSGAVEFGSDASLYVEFKRIATINNFKTSEQGMPVYDAHDVVIVRQPGEKDAPAVMATDWHKMRFPKQWDAFQAQREQTQDGMPLEFLFADKPEIIANLKARKVFTVEQLAGISEQGMSGIGMGARHLVAKATEFLDGMKGAAGIKRLQNQIVNRDEQIATLQAQLKELGDRVESLSQKKAA